ncbi:hypothetical protein DPMN_070163 [Dreissena polymorpha]|uniref:Uncharacterized protein n=1 Tax=Dreissena polymorpha TaxID=45954 RepID=A0A9D4BVG1_DREPO|nr:hypothetical protein DPMN_070163 [Dreissena polymorpha]
MASQSTIDQFNIIQSNGQSSVAKYNISRPVYNIAQSKRQSPSLISVIQSNSQLHSLMSNSQSSLSLIVRQSLSPISLNLKSVISQSLSFIAISQYHSLIVRQSYMRQSLSLIVISQSLSQIEIGQ